MKPIELDAVLAMPVVPTLDLLDYTNPQVRSALTQYENDCKFDRRTQVVWTITQYPTLFDAAYRGRPGIWAPYAVSNAENAEQLTAAERIRQTAYTSKSGQTNPLYSTQPLINLLMLPPGKRPANFGQCVDMFYPTSGPTKFASEGGPFVSTWVNSYAHRHVNGNYPPPPNEGYQSTKPGFPFRSLEKNRIPIDLGDVSMMYGWFLVYRLLLCPRTFGSIIIPNLPDIFMTDQSGERSLDAAATEAVGAQLNTLQQSYAAQKKVLAAASQIADSVAQSAAASGANVTAADVVMGIANNPDVQGILEKGSEHLIDLVGSATGIPKPVLTQLAAHALTGEMPGASALSALNLGQAKSLANDMLRRADGFSPAGADALSTFYLTGERPDLSKFRLDANERSRVQSYITSRARQREGRFKGTLDAAAQEAAAALNSQIARANAAARGARPNGVALAAAIGVKLVGKGINAYVDYKFAQERARLEAELRFYLSGKVYLNPILTEEGYSFALDTFQLTGLPHSDASWIFRPTCEPVQGGQLLTYWKNVWTIFSPIINEVRGGLRVSQALAGRRDCYPDITGQPTLDANGCAPLQIAKLEPQANVCRTFDVFIRNCVKSTELVFDKMPALSHFSWAFGFRPIYVRDPASMSTFISGAPEAGGWEYTTFRKGGYFRPGRSDNYTGLPSWARYYGAHTPFGALRSEDIRAIKRPDLGTHTVFNSQRRISASDARTGSYDSRTRLTFDISRDIPTFNAQWAALMSVLLCYPEALETLAASGYTWAQQTLALRDVKKTPAKTPAKTRAKSAAKTPAKTPAKAAPKKKSSGSRKLAETTSSQKKTTFAQDDERSLTPALISAGTTLAALGVGIFALRKYRPSRLRRMSKPAKAAAAAAAALAVAGAGAAAYMLTDPPTTK